MALTIKNICLQKSQLGLIKNKVFYFPLTNSKRYLRGSRLGKNLTKEETKYRNLLKTLREESYKPIVYHSGNIPIGEVTSPNLNQPSNVVEKTDVSFDTLYKKLEEKITPLKSLSYNKQLEKKYNKSLALLRVFGQKLQTLKVPIALGEGCLPCPVDLTVPSPLVEAYRNQDEFSIGIGLDELTKTVGFHIGSTIGNASAICMSPEELIIIKKSHKDFVKDFQNYLKHSALESFQFNNGGYWRSVKIRSNLAQELMAVITMHPQQLTEEEINLEKDRLKDFFTVSEKPYNLKSLYLKTCTLQKSDFSDGNMSLISGDPYIVEESYRMKLQISPNSFFPSNTKAMDCAYESLLKLCRVRESTTILDIFCGIGPISLTMSPHVQRCIGIDSCSSSIKDAKQNALANNRHNVKFFHGNVEYLISELLSQDYHDDIIAVINPARTELSKAAINCLRACKYLKKIVYITTKPKVAADHFIRLCKPSGAESYLGKYFVPILAVPIDLNPQTDHFALTVMFQRL